MGFQHVPQWVRHVAQTKVDDVVHTVCARCGLELPRLTISGQIVLTKEDRCCIGDDPRATDCHGV